MQRMSVIVAKDKGVTVVTITANSKSVFPPLCQILGAFCCSPVCCSVYKGLMKTCVTAVLGTIQIMVGLMIITLASGQLFTNPLDVNSLGAAYWLGAAFTVVGIMSILAGHVPSPCLVGFTVFMNIVGAIFAIVGITLYAIDLDRHYKAQLYWYDPYDSSSFVTQRLLSYIDAVIITLAALQLSVSFTFVVLGIKALINWKKEEGDEDVEELKQVLLRSPGA
ncbi:membrane-spanning 4-domains subfamily A member 18-like isoform X2 [Thunnus thynnus]|uniref:membrane-spanning 4-domains subfamily A member 18-like isoform X2 n=1 Tax=Thunnus thynnus TaxID=8237 RepID=UPI0035293D2D